MIGIAKQSGNDHISKGEFKLAAAQYRKGLKLIADMRKDKSGENPVQLCEAKEVRIISLHRCFTHSIVSN